MPRVHVPTLSVWKVVMYSAQVITVSDRAFAGVYIDASGPAIEKLLEDADYELYPAVLVPDDKEAIVDVLQKAVANKVNLIVTTGGTGFSKRDVTPEATLDVIERKAAGIPEFMRSISHNYSVNACLSRAEAGLVDDSLIINLPGSPKAAKECLEPLLPALLHGLGALMGERVDG